MNAFSHSNTPDVKARVGKKSRMEGDSIIQFYFKYMTFTKFSREYDHVNTLVEPVAVSLRSHKRLALEFKLTSSMVNLPLIPSDDGGATLIMYQ